MFDHKKFSKDFTVLKLYYLDTGDTDNQTVGGLIRGLAKADLSLLTNDTEKKAFWINVYNGLTSYWIIEKGIQKSMLERPFLTFFSKITIGGFSFSLNDIEHGILRNNQNTPYKIWRQFSDKDARNQFKVKQLDYRIHFALNCGAKSCPAIAHYNAENLDAQLQLAEEDFLAQGFLINEAKKTISCSKIFKFYKKDFKNIYINDPQYKGYQLKYQKYNFGIK